MINGKGECCNFIGKWTLSLGQFFFIRDTQFGMEGVVLWEKNKSVLNSNEVYAFSLEKELQDVNHKQNYTIL